MSEFQECQFCHKSCGCDTEIATLRAALASLQETADHRATEDELAIDKLRAALMGAREAISDRGNIGLTESSAGSIAWHLEQRGDPDVTPKALAAWLRGVERYIGTLHDALAAIDAALKTGGERE